MLLIVQIVFLALNAMLVAVDLYEGVRLMDLGSAFVVGLLLSSIIADVGRK